MPAIPWISTILTTSTTLPSSAEVLSEWGRIPGYQTLRPTGMQEESSRYLVHTKYATLAVSLLDPSDEVISPAALRESCRRAWHWPESALEVAQVPLRQLVVAVMPQEDELDAVDAALLLTAWTCAAVRHTAAVAVYWNASGMVHSAKSFLSRAEGVNRQTIPVELWVEFRLVMHEDLSVSVGSWGLERFGIPELEVVRTRRELTWVLRWIFNVAHFLLEHGAVMENEHTFGQTEDEKFTIRVTSPSVEVGRPQHGQVIQLRFETEDSPQESS